MQVKKKDDGKIYAMKVLKKNALVKRKQVFYTRTLQVLYSLRFTLFLISLSVQHLNNFLIIERTQPSHH